MPESEQKNRRPVAGFRFFCRSAPLVKCEERQARSEFFSAPCTPASEVEGSPSPELYRVTERRPLTSDRGRRLGSLGISLHRVNHHRGKIPTPGFRSPRSSQRRWPVPIERKRRTVRHRPLARRRLLVRRRPLVPERLAVPVALVGRLAPEPRAVPEPRPVPEPQAFPQAPAFPLRPARPERRLGPMPPARLECLVRPAARPDLERRLRPWDPRAPDPCRTRRASSPCQQ